MMQTSIRGKRRRARELAVQALYRHAIAGETIEQAVSQVVELIQETTSRDEPVDRAYLQQIADGVVQHQHDIDPMIAALLHNWSPERLSIVDRTILRLGSYELLFEIDLPAQIIIDEAIELCKRFGGADSNRIINGVLEQVALQVRQNMAATSDNAPKIMAG
ncbi:MAG: transcription antitermination factor NusB [Magnetococcales bacterium]|nr:transcription antitermination factor NusB [Magnetococcales bacterium]